MKFSHLISCLVVCVSLTGCGITASSASDGYADLDSLGSVDVEQTMSLSLGPTLLKFASMNVDHDPDTKIVLEGLDGVRVKTYDVVGNAARVGERIDRMSSKLQEQGWMPIVWVREHNERTVMLVKTVDERILGITVLNTDLREAVVINVMGELRPEMFAETMAALDVDAPVENLPAF